MRIARLASHCSRVACVLLCCPVLRAQLQPGEIAIPQVGTVPYGTYSISKIEKIDAVSGNVQITIPLTAMAPGRAGFGIPIALTYNSSIYTWYQDPVQGPYLEASNSFDPTSSGGWHYSFNYLFTYDLIAPTPGSYSCGQGPPPTFLVRYRLITPDGGSHTLYVSGQSDYLGGYYKYGLNTTTCEPEYPTGNVNLYTADGSYIRMLWASSGQTGAGPLGSMVGGAWTACFPDGRFVQGGNFGTSLGGGFASATDLYDKNDNHIAITQTTDGQGAVTTTLTDDLSRTITVETVLASDSDVITQTGYGGTRLTWTVAYQPVDLDSQHTYYCVNVPVDSCGPPSPGLEVSSITLPDGLEYQFQYGTGDSPQQWGQLSQMTLPSGALVQYSYTTQPAFPLGYAAPPPIFTIQSKALTWLDEDDSACSSGSCPTRVEVAGYTFSNTSSTFTNPDGGRISYFFNDSYASSGFTPFTGLVYQVTQPNGDTEKSLWAVNIPYGTSDNASAAAPWNTVHLPGNPYLQGKLYTYADGRTLSAEQYQSDRNGNQTEIQEFDCLSTTCSYSATGVSGGSLLRTTTNTFANPTGTAVGFAIGSNAQSSSPTISGSNTDDPAAYWHVLSPQILNLTAGTTVGGNNNGSQALLTYDCGSGLTHGNLTQRQDWDSGNSTWVTMTYTYDSSSPTSCVNNGYGNLTSTTNGRGVPTTYVYDSSSLYIQQEILAYGTPDAWTFTFSHDPYTGALTSRTDTAHSIATSYSYDQYTRLNLVNENNVRSKAIAYNDPARTITERTDLATPGDGALIKITSFDQLGRIRLTQDWAGNAVQTRYVTPQALQPGAGYDYELESNPYQSQAESSMGWTLTTRDNVGRVTAVNHFSNSSLPSPWGGNVSSTGVATTSYNDNCTTNSDEATVSRTSCVDGLDRVTGVTENGTGATWSYGYDVLDDLVSVTPPVGTGRTFSYTSLRQLSSATNPESGTVSYAYDADGNLLRRTDARSIVTTYCQDGNNSLCYNGLDQPLGKTYSDSTPPVTFSYNTGWLAQEQAGSNSYTITSWDGIGRVTNASQTTNGQTYGFQVGYTPYVGVRSIQYPASGRIVTTVYDAAGRPYSLSGVLQSNTSNYVTATTYQPHNAIAQQTLANGNVVVNHCNSVNSCDNSRLQPTYLQVGNLLTLQYGYSPSQDNGNVLSQTITRGTQTWSQSYGYTEATGWANNRLACANETAGLAIPCLNSGASWTQTYGYDLAGNRWLINSGPSNPTADLIMGPASGSGPYDGSNRVGAWDSSNCLNGATCYDASGNLLAVPASGGVLRRATYDAENRVSSVAAGGVTTTYSYDAEGRRVQKIVGSTPTVYVYDPLGNLAQEYGPSTAAGTMYLHADPLGSTRLVTDGSGNAQRCYDYLPFGEEIANGTSGRNSCFGGDSYPTSNLDLLDTKFTSKERDAETGLDNFIARYFSSAQGRFTSADEPFADQDESNPQSWNLYAYGRSNPLRNIDPTGRCSQGAGGYVDEGSGLFPGPCSGGQIGEQKAGNNSATVGVGWDEARLIMLQGVGQQFTAHGVAQFVSDAAQATGRLTGATDVAQCLTSGITGSGCSKTGLAMAAIPFGPGRLARILLRHSALSVAKNVSKFAKGLDDAAHVESMVESALASPTRASGYADGAAYIDANLGVTIGTDPTGKATTTIRVVLDNAGNVHSAFPVPQIH